MTDAADPHEVDVDAPLDPEKIMDHARKTHSLSDALKGIKHRHTKVILYRDLEAVDAYAELNRKLQAIVDAAGNADLKTPAGKATQERLLAEHAKLEPELEELRTTMLSSALVVRLKAYPNIAIKTARRDARKKFHDEVLGGVPPEKEAEAREYIDMRLFGESIVDVVDAEGVPLELDSRAELGTMLPDGLPPSQWDRLYNAFITLTLTDQIGTAATEEPGF